MVLLDVDGLGLQLRLRDAVRQLAEDVARTAHGLEQGRRLASSRVLRSNGRTLPLFSDGEGSLLLGWRVWDPLAMASAGRLRWEPYRRRRPQAAGSIAAGPPGGSTITIDGPPQVKISQNEHKAPLGNLRFGASLSANGGASGQAWIPKPISLNV